jgi:hypothetical protein
MERNSSFMDVLKNGYLCKKIYMRYISSTLRSIAFIPNIFGAVITSRPTEEKSDTNSNSRLVSAT